MKTKMTSCGNRIAYAAGVRNLFLLCALLLLGAVKLQAQAESNRVLEVRTLYPSEWDVPYPSGLAYAPAKDHLILLNKITPTSAPITATAVVITPYEDLVGSAQLPDAIDDAINIAYDEVSDHLLLLNSKRAELSTVQVGEDGIPDVSSLVRADVAHLDLQVAAGMGVDPADRLLFILDSGALAVVSVSLDAGFTLRNTLDLSYLGVADLRGMAVHPISKNLFTVSQHKAIMYELTSTGSLVNTYDLANLALVDARGLAFAPSADRTDAPETIHLYIADSNLPDFGEDAAAAQFGINQLYLPLVIQSLRSVFLGARTDVDAATTGQVFGRILEVALEPGPTDGSSTQLITAQVAAGTDDSEENVDTGATHLASSDLELIRDGDRDQLVGIRFSGLEIPLNAVIVDAYVEFEADEPGSAPTALVFHGEAADDAAPFAEPNSDLSRRSLTVASVTWPEVPAWEVAHEKHQTPNLAPIIQEIVDRSGWRSGNAIAFLIAGSGTRTAAAYEGDPTGAPRLVVEYSAAQTVNFAVIGDYGRNSADEAQVAALVESWHPDFVITTGDNNYPDGEAATIDDNIGQYYSQFIGNYQGAYGPGSAVNRFWPSLGNHDWHTITCVEENCTGAYFDYFTLPNNERYYAVDQGLVHLFAVDSDSAEPDGLDQNSIQAAWLQSQLAASTACYDLVYFHHAPYSSGRHGSNSTMQWPFADWGADAVFSGHDHLYERLDVGGLPYFVNGAGGAGLYTFDNITNLPPQAVSLVRYNLDYGAMLVTATNTAITYQFYRADGALIDTYTEQKDCANASPTPNPSPGATATATLAVTSAPPNSPPPTATPTPSRPP